MGNESGGGSWLADHWEGLTAAIVGAFAAIRWAWQARMDRRRERREERETAFDTATRMLDELRAEKASADAENASLRSIADGLRRELAACAAQREGLSRALGDSGLRGLAESMAAAPDSLGELLDYLPNPLVITRKEDAVFLYPNAAFCRLLRASRAQLQAEDWRLRVLPEDLAQTEAIERRALVASARRVVIANNRFCTGEDGRGEPIALNWVATVYLDSGISLAWAEVDPAALPFAGSTNPRI